MIAESPFMKNLLADLDKIAKSCASVLIHGESGTGKEVVAHAIHYRSSRSAQAFVKVNCAAIPETLLESEFFGHEKGSFTGAINRRLGRFELASGGTLLLDEISEIPLSLQSKLLRVVQEQEFDRVGGSRPIQVDVRLISTSNRNMKEAISNKLFREDLYYRLNVVPIYLPPLRERKEDILPLAQYFLQQHDPNKIFSLEAKQKLLEYSWPGNIRELANIIQRTMVLSSNAVIGAEDLHLEEPVTGTSPKKLFTLKELEKKHILDTLVAYEQNRTQTAKALGISVRTLRNKLSSYRE
jgi:two-component system response regulator AtoC